MAEAWLNGGLSVSSDHNWTRLTPGGRIEKQKLNPVRAGVPFKDVKGRAARSGIAAGDQHWKRMESAMKKHRPARLLTATALAAVLAACGTRGVSPPDENQESAASVESVALPPPPPPLAKSADMSVRVAPPAVMPAPVPAAAMARQMEHARIALPQHQGEDRERYAQPPENSIVVTAEQPFSTFSIDVDTGSYANVRRFINNGSLPPRDAVRVEEMLNYFPYDYAEPPKPMSGSRAPFGVTTELASTPWNPDTLLLRVGIKAFDQPRAALPPANLVFLVDVSGSMNDPNKLPLLKRALGLLVDQLRPQDNVSLVTYASGTRIVLEPTPGSEKAKIRLAIEQLVPGGSTAGAAGLELAYRMAGQGFTKDGINRILLATDGDFNVGISNFETLKQRIEEKRQSGVSLTTLGFGDGNYNEPMMEQLADAGDGNYAYIDTLNEAQKVLVDELTSTLSIVARDVKIQLEFNPAAVSEYRLIGYENRKLAREDFRNDKVDAGEIGAGHSVTALYELTPAGTKGRLEPGRYARQATTPDAAHTGEIGMLRLRYKTTQGSAAQEIETPLMKHDVRNATKASEDMRFAAAVAAFGQQLRGGKYLGTFGYGDVEALAAGARGTDRFGYRGEFLRMVRLASSLATKTPQAACTGNDCTP